MIRLPSVPKGLDGGLEAPGPYKSRLPLPRTGRRRSLPPLTTVNSDRGLAQQLSCRHIDFGNARPDIQSGAVFRCGAPTFERDTWKLCSYTFLLTLCPARSARAGSHPIIATK